MAILISLAFALSKPVYFKDKSFKNELKFFFILHASIFFVHLFDLIFAPSHIVEFENGDGEGGFYFILNFAFLSSKPARFDSIFQIKSYQN